MVRVVLTQHLSLSPFEGTQLRGLLITNLGTPRSPDKRDVAEFLDEFLSDPRVVDLPRWLWLPLLRLVIIPLRAGKSAEAYREIWTEQGSPLLVNGLDLAAALRERLGSPVEIGMRYGSPSIANTNSSAPLPPDATRDARRGP